MGTSRSVLPLILLLASVPVVGTVTTMTLAGSGTVGDALGIGTAAKFDTPHGIAVAPSGAFALVHASPSAPTLPYPPAR